MSSDHQIDSLIMYGSLRGAGPACTACIAKMKSTADEVCSYWFADIDDLDFSAILKVYNLRIPTKLYSEGEIDWLKSVVKVF